MSADDWAVAREEDEAYPEACILSVVENRCIMSPGVLHEISIGEDWIQGRNMPHGEMVNGQERRSWMRLADNTGRGCCRQTPAAHHAHHAS